MLNETLIFSLKESRSRNGASASSFGNTSRCQLCQSNAHTTMACPKHNDMWPKCDKCGGGHNVENYGIRCSLCNGLWHLKDRYWKKKDIKHFNSITNYLEVLVNDEKATFIELNMICGANQHLSSKNMIPKRRFLM